MLVSARSRPDSTKVGADLERGAIDGVNVEVLDADEALALGRVGCVAVMLWAGPATPARMTRASEAVVAIAARARPHAVGVVMVVEPGSPIPSPEALDRTTAILAETVPRLAGCAFVMEGGGEWSVEAFDTTSDAHARMGVAFVRKYCVGTREASAWLSARVQDGEDAPTREELLAGIETIRAALRR